MDMRGAVAIAQVEQHAGVVAWRGMWASCVVDVLFGGVISMHKFFVVCYSR